MIELIFREKKNRECECMINSAYIPLNNSSSIIGYEHAGLSVIKYIESTMGQKFLKKDGLSLTRLPLTNAPNSEQLNSIKDLFEKYFQKQKLNIKIKLIA